MSRQVAPVTLFHQTRSRRVPGKIVCVDMLCLLKIEYLDSRAAVLYVDHILNQLTAQFAGTILCVFTINHDPGVRELVARKLHDIQIHFFVGETIGDIIRHVKAIYLFPFDIYFMSVSSKILAQIPENYLRLQPSVRQGMYDEDDYQALLDSIVDDIGQKRKYTLCLDIDDTVVLLNTKRSLTTTHINGAVVELVEALAQEIEVEEILFLTARFADSEGKWAPLEENLPPLSEEYVMSIAEVNSINVRVIAYYFNQSLQEKNIPAVSRVMYSNAGYNPDEIVSRKYQILKQLKDQGKHPILIDNSRYEINAVRQLREISQTYSDLSPPIRICEHHELNSEDLANMTKLLAISSSIPEPNDSSDSAIEQEKSVSCTP